MGYYDLINNNDIEGMRQLLSSGWCPSADMHFPIQLTCRIGGLEIFKLLMEHPKTKVHLRNNICISNASEYGHIEIVKILLNDPRVDPTDDYSAPIRYASENKHMDIVRLLLTDKRVRDAFKVVMKENPDRYPSVEKALRQYKIERLEL